MTGTFLRGSFGELRALWGRQGLTMLFAMRSLDEESHQRIVNAS